jgi:ATP-binding cassette subfamily B protein
MKIIWRVSAYLFRYKFLFLATLALAIGSTLFFIAIPRVIQFIFDDIIGGGRLDALGWAVAVIALCYFAREGLNSLRIRINNTLEQKVLIDLRRDLHAKLLDLPVSFYDRRKSGDIASRVIEDVNGVERALLDGTEQGTVAILTMVGILIILFTSQPFLAIFVCLPLPILYALARQHGRITKKNWRAVRDSAGELNSLLVEDIQANRLIHSFALKDRESERFEEKAQDLRFKTLKAMFRYSIYGPGSSFISSLGTVAVVGVGGYLLITRPGEFTSGQFIAFFAYCGMLYEPVFRLTMLNQMIATGRASGERVFELVDYPIDIKSPESPVPVPPAPIEIGYEAVRFHYPEREDVIPDLDLSLPAGKVTALVGHTGAGKSTIANLLQRYYDPSGGRVTWNGRDIRDFDLGELRSQIGVVAQDPFLFDATVAENLRLACPGASDDQIRVALEGACAIDFVDKLPDGMNTQIGERGVRLSMGEKQRLTIARVLLKNPPIVILDEATASVDTLTERHIQDALKRLVANRTVLVIAHRLSTIRDADQIVVLDQGRIIEKGDHTSLLDENGQYARLWHHQEDVLPADWE